MIDFSPTKYDTLGVYVLGSGRASNAILSAFQILANSEKKLLPRIKVIKMSRAEGLVEPSTEREFSVCVIATPHALHAPQLIEADKLGFDLIFCEKPAAVDLDQIKALSDLKTPVAIMHGYRQSWGVHKIKKLVEENSLGELVSVEGRYWQSSVSQKRRDIQNSDTRVNWKNDTTLSGYGDVVLDLAPHWMDAACFVTGSTQITGSVWKSFASHEASHRDTHVHLSGLIGDKVKFFGSVSKITHGYGNFFEMCVLGTEAMAEWTFSSPDQIKVSRGSEIQILQRSVSEKNASDFAPGHSLGWLDGYVNIIAAAMRLENYSNKTFCSYPNLADHLNVMEFLLR